MQKSALVVTPESMTLIPGKEEVWKHYVKINSDAYGSGVVRFAEKWARIMESRIANGERIEDCADDACSIADDEGITGFMYGCAVQILSEVWVHGEQLRRWHNIKTQVQDEGERANESGGVLNPALLSFG